MRSWYVFNGRDVSVDKNDRFAKSARKKLREVAKISY